jgi:hypothetical protein
MDAAGALPKRTVREMWTGVKGEPYPTTVTNFFDTLRAPGADALRAKFGSNKSADPTSPGTPSGASQGAGTGVDEAGQGVDRLAGVPHDSLNRGLLAQSIFADNPSFVVPGSYLSMSPLDDLAAPVATATEQVAEASRALTEVEQALTERFERIAAMPVSDGEAVLTRAVKVRADQFGGADLRATMADSLVEGPPGQAVSALDEALDQLGPGLARAAQDDDPALYRALRAARDVPTTAAGLQVDDVSRAIRRAAVSLR